MQVVGTQREAAGEQDLTQSSSMENNVGDCGASTVDNSLERVPVAGGLDGRCRRQNRSSANGPTERETVRLASPIGSNTSSLTGPSSVHPDRRLGSTQRRQNEPHRCRPAMLTMEVIKSLTSKTPLQLGYSAPAPVPALSPSSETTRMLLHRSLLGPAKAAPPRAVLEV